MANGIEDLMSIRTTGGTQNVPPRPPMQGGLASMGAGQPTMPPVVEDQMSMPPMGGQEMPSEQPQEMSIEQDAAMLAEATIGRTGGDPQAAVAILDTAKAMLMQVGQEEPMMMKNGGGLNPGLTALAKKEPELVEKITGKPLPENMNMGGPLYAQDGLPLTDAEVLKQMIMDNIRENPILNSESVQPISPMGYTKSGRTLSDRDRKQMMDDSDSDVSKDELRGIYGKSRIFNMRKR